MKRHIKSQTGLRGLAALCVIPAHIHLNLVFPKYILLIIYKIFPSGYAVNLFFMLSGFILCHVYQKENGQLKTSWRSFFTARIMRICPLYYVLLGTSIVFYFASSYKGFLPNGSFDGIGSQLLFIHTFPYIEIKPVLTGSWSLSMEMFAYFTIFPVGLWILSRIKLNQLINFILIFACIVGCIMFEKYLRASGEKVGYIGWLALNRVVFFFFSGMLIQQLATNHSNLTDYFVRRADAFILAALSLHALYVFDYMPKEIFGFLLPILLLCFSTDGKSISSRILQKRAIVYLGVISYSLYLTHPIIGKIGFILHQKGFFEIKDNFYYVVIVLASTIVISSMTYRFIEEPGRHLLDNLAGSLHLVRMKARQVISRST